MTDNFCFAAGTNAHTGKRITFSIGCLLVGVVESRRSSSIDVTYESQWIVAISTNDADTASYD